MQAEALTTIAPLPAFSQIQPSDIEARLDQILEHNLAQVEQLLAAAAEPGWDNLMAPMEALEDSLNQFWSPVSHLNSVCNSDELREVYNRCLPKIAEYGTRLSQHRGLYEACRQVLKREGERLDEGQRQALENQILEFTLGGVALEEPARSRYGEIRKRLSELSNQFSNNVLDATMGWTLHETDAARLQGLPPSARDQAARAAAAKQLPGYLFTLDIPSYLPVMTHANDRGLRREMYQAYSTRASDAGPQAGKWDNRPLIEEILALRHEMAGLLGFANYAELSLARKMADSTEQVIGFLEDLVDRSRPMAEQELSELRQFAASEHGIDQLEPWDVAWLAEKLRQQRFSLSQEELRPYFPLHRVLQGLFEITGTLFGIEFQPRMDVDTWHPDVRYYDVLVQGQVIAGVYLDLYARQRKQGGAWMDECLGRRILGPGQVQRPVAWLVCNFTPPADHQSSLLTHSEVVTLFHEFGHGLHHMLTQVDHAAVSGIHGVAWDAVELPSQLLENWCWQEQTIPLISAHHETGEPLPAAMLERMLAARNFHSGMMMLRQLEFALFDFRLHLEYQAGADAAFVEQVLQRVRERTALIELPEWNRFQNSFSHIFAGGYAAGYYSYKWAEVLSADVFARFQEQGVLNPAAGREFLQRVLSRGGSRPAMQLFVDYRGREPSIEPLLLQAGITRSTPSQATSSAP